METDNFVTQKWKLDSKNSNLNQSPPNIHVGRPNLETIIQDVRKEAEQQGVSHVGVRLWTESDGWEVERNLRG